MSEELRIDIKSMTLPELTALMKDWGESGFRAGQLFSWLHEKRVQDWSEMTNLSAAGGALYPDPADRTAPAGIVH